MTEYVLNDVIKAVDELRHEFKFFIEPRDEEVAVRVGETPETVRPILFKLAPKIGWKEQKKEEAEKRLRTPLTWLVGLSGLKRRR